MVGTFVCCADYMRPPLRRSEFEFPTWEDIAVKMSEKYKWGPAIHSVPIAACHITRMMGKEDASSWGRGSSIDMMADSIVRGTLRVLFLIHAQPLYARRVRL